LLASPPDQLLPLDASEPPDQLLPLDADADLLFVPAPFEELWAVQLPWLLLPELVTEPLAALTSCAPLPELLADPLPALDTMLGKVDPLPLEAVPFPLLAVPLPTTPLAPLDAFAP